MAASQSTEMHHHGGEPAWLAESVQLLRSRGYLTTFVRIGYELVLIVSGPTGEIAVVDLSYDTGTILEDAWAGMRQVLPGMPVVAVVPEGEYEQFKQSQTPVIPVCEPGGAEEVVQAVERLIQPQKP